MYKLFVNDANCPTLLAINVQRSDYNVDKGNVTLSNVTEGNVT